MKCDPLVMFPKGGFARFPHGREAFPVLRRLQRGPQLTIELGLSSGPRAYKAETLEPVPQVGDEVLVLAQPYADWIHSRLEEIKAQSGGKKTPQYRMLAGGLNDFEWMAHEFTLKRLEGQMATIQGHGLRRELPHWCLAVLRRVDA